MRIYNEVITIFNENTGLWETISEDSYNYNGPIALAQGGMPVGATAISAQDTVSDTIKTTAGYFTGGDGTLSGDNIHTGSFEEAGGATDTPVNDANKDYYFNVLQTHPNSASVETQFSVAFAHYAGSGSDQYGDSSTDPKNIIGSTQALYKQLSNILLDPTEISDGFTISQAGSGGVITGGNKDEYLYVLIGKRARFKDRMNKKVWTLALSGSCTTGSGAAPTLYLTDDSATTAAAATPGGYRYNIVSGTLGNVSGSGASYKTYGWFYRERGLMVFSGHELSASIPGGPNYGSGLVNNITASHGTNRYSSSAGGFSGLSVGDLVQITSKSLEGARTTLNVQVSHSLTSTYFTGSRAWSGTTAHETGSLLVSIPTTDITASFSTDTLVIESSSGFAPNLNAQANSNNALRLAICMRNMGSSNTFRLRSEEDATQENYFCRIRANDYNFSANPTFTSGSFNKIRHIGMHGNPTSFITGVGLYNSSGQLLAIAELSKPIKKNFASEATIKVKLTY